MFMEDAIKQTRKLGYGALVIGALLAAALITAPRSWAGTNPNLSLEKHYDEIFGAKLPMLDQAIRRVSDSRNAYLSNTFEPYVSIVNSGPGSVSGTTANGDIYTVKIGKSGSGIEARFLKNGSETYRFDMHAGGDAKSGIELTSTLHNVLHPAYDVSIDVYKGHGTHAGYRDALLKIGFAGRQVTENVWPGKQQFDNLTSLVSMLSSLPELHDELSDYFYLLSRKADYAGYSWDALDAFPGVSGNVQTVSGSSTGGMKPRKISGDEAYWCGVGTMGADVVFTLAGSFFYGAICGGLAAAS